MAKKDSDIDSFTLPSNPADRKKIRDAFYEISGAHQFIKDKREYIKDVVVMLHETYGMPKKLIPKIAKIVFEHNYAEVAEENSTLELIFESILESSDDSSSSSASDED